MLVLRIGGARRDRTADPLHAMQVLSQLSYGPKRKRANLRQAPPAVNTVIGLEDDKYFSGT
jgi:hypothetical protein